MGVIWTFDDLLSPPKFGGPCVNSYGKPLAGTATDLFKEIPRRQIVMNKPVLTPFCTLFIVTPCRLFPTPGRSFLARTLLPGRVLVFDCQTVSEILFPSLSPPFPVAGVARSQFTYAF